MSQHTICHVFSSFGPGGAELRMCSIMRALGAEFRHLIVAANNDYSARDWVPSDAVDVQLVGVPASRRPRLLDFREFFSSQRPDLVVTYNWGAMDAAMALRLPRRIPHIHHEHGFGPDEADGLKIRRVWTRRIVLRGAFATIVPSRTLERIALEQYRLPPAQVRYIANGVDTERFRPRDDARRSAAGLDPGALVFGFVGRFGGEKDLPTLLQALAKLNQPGIRLVLAGSGPQQAQLEQLVATLGLGDRVEFAGPLRDVRPFLASLDVFVLSSITEQMPMSLLEAMAGGLPAIATAVGDCPYLIGTSSPLLVPPRDPDALAAAMARIAADPCLRSRLGLENRLRCEQQYSFRRMVQEWAGTLRAAIARGY